MGHAQNEVGDAASGCLLDEVLEKRDDDFAALQGKALLAEKLAVQKGFEEGSFHQFAQDSDPSLLVERGAVARSLHPFPEPTALVRILDMHEFHADRAAVGLPQNLQDLPQGGALLGKPFGVEGRVLVRLLQAEGFEAQKGVIAGAGVERIDAGLQMPKIAVAEDEGLNGRLFRRLNWFRCRRSFRRLLSEVKAGEKGAPVGRDLFRRLAPETILGLDPLRTDVLFETHE